MTQPREEGWGGCATLHRRLQSAQGAASIPHRAHQLVQPWRVEGCGCGTGHDAHALCDTICGIHDGQGEKKKKKEKEPKVKKGSTKKGSTKAANEQAAVPKSPKKAAAKDKVKVSPRAPVPQPQVVVTHPCTCTRVHMRDA